MSELETTSTTVVVKEATSAVASALRDIYTVHKSLTPALVVSEASDPSSPLHDYFDWDDASAGEKFRLGQAAALIRKVKVTIVPAGTNEPIAVRAYVAERDVETGSTPGSYLPIETVAGSTAYQLSLKESIERDLERLRNKYHSTLEYFDSVAQDWLVELNAESLLEDAANSAA